MKYKKINRYIRYFLIIQLIAFIGLTIVMRIVNLHNPKSCLVIRKNMILAREEQYKKTHEFAAGGDSPPKCDIFGYYSSIQSNGSSGYSWCVDKNGNQIPGTDYYPPSEAKKAIAVCKSKR